MDNTKKTLKSPLSAEFCNECMAKVAGEAQKSIAKHVLPGIEYALIQATDSLEQLANVEQKLNHLKTFLKEFLKKPE